MKGLTRNGRGGLGLAMGYLAVGGVALATSGAVTSSLAVGQEGGPPCPGSPAYPPLVAS